MKIEFNFFGRENSIKKTYPQYTIQVTHEVTDDIVKLDDSALVYREKQWAEKINRTIADLMRNWNHKNQEVLAEKYVFKTKVEIKERLSLAVDFDDTLFSAEIYPIPGHPIIENINLCREWLRNENILILNTAREGQNLELAVSVCKEYQLEFDYINQNIDYKEKIWGYSRKIVADYYLDDRNRTVSELKDIIGGKQC